MTETKRQIKELKAVIPYVREKLIAIATMLALSLTMMASVSYAWYTMSLAPEVTGITTQIAGNGNLEVALAGLYDKDGNLIAPLDSAVGDSLSAKDQTTVKANLTWGNLINLSDNYGIEEIVLRPASLDSDSDFYLSSMKYGEDGRIEGTTTDFGFTLWELTDKQTNTHSFVLNNKSYGVRAISSIGFKGEKTVTQIKLTTLKEMAASSRQAYSTIMNEKKYIDALTGLVQTYLDANINAALSSGDSEETDIDCREYVEGLSEMMTRLYDEAVCPFGDSLAYMANIQLSFKYGDDYTPVTRESMTAQGLKGLGVEMNNTLEKYLKLERELYSNVLLMQEYAKKAAALESVYWSSLQPIVDDLISINTVVIEHEGKYKQVGTIMSEVKAVVKSNPLGATGYINKFNDPLPILIKKGLIWSFEELSGARMFVTLYNLKLSVIKTFNESQLQTDLGSKSSLFSADYDVTEGKSDGAVNTNQVALDTYGMVVDIWTRTNAPNSLLTLDGLLEVDTTWDQKKVIVSGESQSRLVYVYDCPTTLELAAGIYETEEVEVFKGDDGYYYSVKNYAKMYIMEVQEVEVTDAEGNTTKVKKVVKKQDKDGNDFPLTDADVRNKMVAVNKVVGFKGSNRVYDEGKLDLDLSAGEISAMQGSGSCFIFYADTPEDYENALGMLSRMKLAFFDQNNNKLAEAKLDIEYVFGESGKYTIPITIEQTNYTAVDAEGNTVYGITALQQNAATLITTVIYLEGEGLENSMVLSGQEIQGSLNLQFSTSEKLTSWVDNDLLMQTISLSAKISGNNSFEYSGAVQYAKLEAVIDGLNINEDATVEAVFLRQITSAQGTRMSAVELTNTEGNLWTAQYPFTLPGTYVLNTLIIDGVHYDLPNKVTVSVSGFAINFVSFCAREEDQLALTAEKSVTRSVTIGFNTAYQPKRVEAKIKAPDDSYVTATLTRDGQYWTGDAVFNSSGTYTLEYLVLDDAYYDIKELYSGQDEINTSFTAYLGLRARVYLQREGGLEFIYDYINTEYVTVMAEILTDTDETLKNLADVSVQYARRGSTILGEGLDTELMRWEGGYYTGTFPVDMVGVFNFAQMTVGNNVITTAISAPTITSRPKDPPAFEASSTNTGATTMVLTTTDPVYYVADITNAEGASNMFALFVHTNGEEIWVPFTASKTDGSKYYFAVPATEQYANRNGVWTVKQINLWGVQDENGTLYGEENPYILAIEDYGIQVLEAMDVSVTPLELGNGAAFLTEQSIATITTQDKNVTTYHGSVKITIKGVALDALGLKISSVTLSLKNDGEKITAYGGYTPSGTTGFETISDIALTDPDGDGIWTISSGTARLAGTYDGTLTIVIADKNDATKTYTYTFNPTQLTSLDNFLTVKSATPTVTITAVTPTGTYSADTNKSGTVEDTSSKKVNHTEKSTDCNGNETTTTYYDHTWTTNSAHKTGHSSTITSNGLTATVYFKCFHADDATYSGGTNTTDTSASNMKYHAYMSDAGYGVPTVTLTLNGISGFTSAKLEVSDSTYIYSGITYTGSGLALNGTWETTGGGAEFSWTSSSMSVTRYIGYCWGQKERLGDTLNATGTKTPAGTITADTLIVVYGGITYEFTIPTVTINNPY